ncbi:MAG: hypothetical protein GAK45_01901 [Pseudomonas citronellolis]|nr:MAG: hypothetical protein GAK45_01901 [Pseudomonas citronellolis]
MHNTVALIGSGLCMLVAGLATSYWLRQRELPMARLGGSLAGLLASSLFLSVVPLVSVQVPGRTASTSANLVAQAQAQCAAQVRTRLERPDSAEFPATPPASVSHTDNEYQVQARVVARNYQNEAQPHAYRCALRYQGTAPEQAASWQLLSLDFD